MMFRTIFFFLLGVGLWGQTPPYDVFPDADPPYYRLRYEANPDPGKLQFPVKYTVWIPEGVERLEGLVVHQHGCGEGSCKSGLTGAWDLHWQALAQKHKCALLAPSYEQPEKANCQLWCDPRNGSGEAFLQALKDLGKISSHPELGEVPWALWGHSGGGHWAGGMTLLYPERVVACWLRSGVPLLESNPERENVLPHAWNAAALQVPMMCNPGTKEGVTVKTGRFARVWSANQRFFSKIRHSHGLIGIAVDPLSAHECGNQRYLAIPWFDACLEARLPKVAGESLRNMPSGQAWYAQILDEKAVPAKEYSGNPNQAVWLPNAKIAKQWMHYVKDTEIPDRTPPPSPFGIRVSGNRITWQAQADFESGISHFIVRKNGKVIGRVPEKPTNRFGRPLFQGLQYSDTPLQPLAKMEFVDPNAGDSQQYQIISVNTMGLMSEN